MNKKISLFSLVLLIVSAIDSIRTLPTTAYFGSSLIFFFLLSAFLFLIPVALVSAEFSSRFPEQGGVFHWVRHAFGNRTGVLAVWLQWINTMVWYPTMLLFIAGTVAHLIDPTLASNKLFLLATTLITFWGLTLLNLKGIQVSARVNSFCGTIGTLFPMIFLIALGAWWAFKGNHVSISFSSSAILPTFNLLENSGALVTIMASFLGMELAGVHVGDIQNPQKNFPKAIGFSVLILIGTLMFGSLSVAAVIPKNEIHFVDGIMQTFTTFFDAFGILYLKPVLAFLIIIGSAGGSVNWLLSPAKGLLQAAEHNFLPPFFVAKNKHGVSVRILILQAVVVSIFCLSIQLIPSVNAYYWFLMALSTGLYMIMYVLLFLSAIKLGRPEKIQLSYSIPQGTRTLSCIAGLVGCTLTILVGFQPAPGSVANNPFQYAFMIAGGFALLIFPVCLLWLYQKRLGKMPVI